MLKAKSSYRMSFDLSGRVAVITGGAGILGEHFCAALADHGARIAVVDIDVERTMQLASDLQRTYGTDAAGFVCDVADPAAVDRLVEDVTERLGPVSVLVNNAATKTDDLRAFFADPEHATLETWREVMAVNLDGLFLVAQAFGTTMAARGTGSIIQTSSIYGLAGPDQRIYEDSDYLGGPISTPAVYSTSKAGVVGLTRHLATFWGPRGVRVNALAPGGVASGQNDVFARRYAARVPLGRMAEADEMAGPLVFLASDASSYVTGQTLTVDGGLLTW